MATKKKPARSTKKTKKSTVKVQLDAKTLHQFESHLRDGLVLSGAVMSKDNKTPSLKPTAQVELDAPTVARLSEALRKGLVSSQAVMASDSEKLDNMTGGVKGTPTRSKKKR